MPPPAIMPGRGALGRLCQRSITAGTHWISVGARLSSASSSGRSAARSPSRSNSAPAMPAERAAAREIGERLAAVAPRAVERVAAGLALGRAQRAQHHRVEIDLGLRADLEPAREPLERIGVGARDERREVDVGLLEREVQRRPDLARRRS